MDSAPPMILPAEFEAMLAQGRIAQAAGRVEQAGQVFRAILEAHPDHPETLHRLGAACHAMGQSDEAIALMARSIALAPEISALHYNFGTILHGLDRLDEAETAFRRALELEPGKPEIWFNLGGVLLGLKRWGEAEQAMRAALAQSPADPQGWLALARALTGQTRHAAAIEACHRALAITEGAEEGWIGLGDALAAAREPDMAAEAYREVLHRNPDHPVALLAYGEALSGLGRLGEAEQALARAAMQAPDSPAPLQSLGVVLQQQGRLENAAGAFAAAHHLAPDRPAPLVNLGNVFEELGQLDDAAEAYRAALAIDPELSAAEAPLVHVLQRLCDWTEKFRETRILHALRTGRAAPPPFQFLMLDSTPEQQRHCAETHIRRHFPNAAPGPRLKSRPAKLVIGYLSGDFHDHATAHLMAELLECHDRDRFTIMAFSHGPDDGSPMRHRLVHGVDRFIDIARASHDDAAGAVRDQGVHILVDLKGHTRGNRLGVMARRPAPIQAHYLGYPGTIGAPFIDYLIADSVVVPPGDDGFYSEALVRLPFSYQVNDRNRPMPLFVPERAEQGLPPEGPVLACFNNLYKLGPAVFDVWCGLLRDFPAATLWLLETNPQAAENLRGEAKARGIGAERLVFSPIVSQADHLDRLALADLFLDTLPCNAHTTASDALWAGVPVLTCLGQSFTGRVAASLVQALGLGEDLAMPDLDSYDKQARALLADPARLAGLKERLIAGRHDAPLWDTPRFTKTLEAAYQRMMERHLTGAPPQSFTLDGM